MHPVFFEIPGLEFPIRFFGLFVVSAFLLSTLWGQWLFLGWRDPAIAENTSIRRRMRIGALLLVVGRILCFFIPAGWGVRLGLVLAVDIFVYVWCRRRLIGALPENRIPDADMVFNLAFLLIVAGFVGARLFWVITTPSGREAFIVEPFRALFAVWDGGIVYYGGLLLSTAAGIWFVRRRGLGVLAMGDWLLVGLSVSLFIGRWACFSAGCDFGGPTDAPWGLVYEAHPRSLIPEEYQGKVALHPSQIYLSLNGLVLFLILWAAYTKKRFDGQILALFLMLYAIGRSIAEAFRADVGRGIYSLTDDIILSTSQLISVPVFLAGAVLYVVAWRRSRTGEVES